MDNFKADKIGSDIRQSERYGKYMEANGWKSIKCQGAGASCQVLLRRLGPVAIAKIQRPGWPIDWGELNKILKTERVMMCKIEPETDGLNEDGVRQELTRQGFRPDNWPLIPSKTMWIDISRNETERMAELKPDTRHKIRKLIKTDHKILINDYEGFFAIFSKAFKKKGVWAPGKKMYQSLVNSMGDQCFTVTVNGESGCLVMVWQNRATYYYAATSDKGKRENLPYLVVWTALEEARKRGARLWDFEGIFDPRWPNPAWKGFSYFKERFSGRMIENPGCFTKWRWPF